MTMNSSVLFRRLAWVVTGLLVIIGVAIVVRRSLLLFPVVLHGYRPPAPSTNPTAEFDEIFARSPWLTLGHILPGLVFVVLGPFQFSARLRARHLVWHRRLGYLVFGCGLVTGLTAGAMSFFMPAIGGVNQATATALFSVLFVGALVQGYRLIRRREIIRHREWMIRAFALGLAIATIRPIVGVFFATRLRSGLTPREFFGTAFWLGFVLHLIAAEVWINGTRAGKSQERPP